MCWPSLSTKQPPSLGTFDPVRAKELPNILQQLVRIRERREVPTTFMHLQAHHIPSPPCPTQRRPISNIIRGLTDTHRLLNIRQQIDLASRDTAILYLTNQIDLLHYYADG